jgi:hypothetical protein
LPIWREVKGAQDVPLQKPFEVAVRTASGRPAVGGGDLQVRLIRDSLRQREQQGVRGHQGFRVQLLQVRQDNLRRRLPGLLHATRQQRGFPHLARSLDQHDAILPRQRGRELPVCRALHVERRAEGHRAADGLVERV